jgi:ribosome maturation factor RimP
MSDLVLKNLLDEIAERNGTHVVDLVFRGERNSQVIELFVDSEAAMTTDQCARISRDALTRIEETNAVTGTFRLVVSSPGIQRPLKFPWQYRKHVGRELILHFGIGAMSRTTSGKLVQVEKDTVVLDTKGESKTVPFSEISEAIVKAPW